MLAYDLHMYNSSDTFDPSIFVNLVYADKYYVRISTWV